MKNSNNHYKFRAWDKVSKQMFKVYSIEFREDGIWACLDWMSKVTGLRENWLSPDRLELIQFTGLKDKNGKEIYEGDIVRRTRLYNPNHISIGEVIFRKGMFEADYGNWIFENFGDINNNNMIIEVIGNIYENPELLK